jgi:hypothetical protein
MFHVLVAADEMWIRKAIIEVSGDTNMSVFRSPPIGDFLFQSTYVCVARSRHKHRCLIVLRHKHMRIIAVILIM